MVDTEHETWRSRVVVIATGHFELPILPKWPDQEKYTGLVMHSATYKTGRAYARQRVLVTGIGNSGAEIAAGLAEQGAALVAISVRTPPPVVPRDFLGTPVQVFGILLSPLPPHVADGIGYALARLALGDLTRYGLEPPAWLPFTAKRIPIIDVGFVQELKRERVHIRPTIARFTRTGVVYENGHEEAFDIVLLATGFQTGMDQWLDIPGVLNSKSYPRFLSGRLTSQPGLYFMSYAQSHRGHLFEANRDSRRLARVIADYLAG